MQSYTVYFIRHGAVDETLKGKYIGSTDVDLSEKGRNALKKISEGNNLEKYLDMDNILKYMAVHTFAVNMDSLSGSMAHNYYLYEYKGQLNMLPWDYNLSFGGMSMGGTDGSGVVNDAIDTPFSGTNFFDAILEDEEYSAKYHEYLQKLVDEYVNGGRFEEVYNRIRSRINELVKTDPTAFYNYDEYEAGAEMLYKTIMLRTESVKGQLDGTIPSTDEGQKADSSSLVDASEIDVKVMGQMNMGGGSGGFGGFGAKPGESQNDTNDKKESGEDSKEENTENSKEDSSEKSIEKEFERNDVVDNNGKSDSNDKTTEKNLVIYGVCFALMILSLIVLKLMKRNY